MIFRQDRMLQSALNSEDAATLARLISKNPQWRKTYEFYLKLVSGLTNPSTADSLVPLMTQLHQDAYSSVDKLFFFPPSRSFEGDLIRRIFPPGKLIPENFSLSEELIRQVQSGELNLQPTKQSGWYDWQAWALEPLLRPGEMPEGKKLVIDENYQESLKVLFKGVFAQNRETHAKNLELPTVNGSRIPDPEAFLLVKPDFGDFFGGR